MYILIIINICIATYQTQWFITRNPLNIRLIFLVGSLVICHRTHLGGGSKTHILVT